jgi:hypothetical protein
MQLDEVPPSLLAGQPVAGPYGQAVEPGFPRVGVAEGAQVPPSRDERLLDRVLGAVAVAEDEGGDGVLTVEGDANELGEGLAVSPSRQLDQLPSLHATTGPSRLTRPRSW